MKKLLALLFAASLAVGAVGLASHAEDTTKPYCDSKNKQFFQDNGYCQP